MSAYKNLLLSALILGIGTQALATEVEYQTDNTAPIRFHRVAPTVIVHKGLTQLVFNNGAGTLDTMRTFHCFDVKYGCLVTAQIWVSFAQKDPQGEVNGYLDDQQMGPEAPGDVTAVLTTEQSRRVTSGSHAFQTKYQDPTHSNTIISGYQIIYTVYDRRLGGP